MFRFLKSQLSYGYLLENGLANYGPQAKSEPNGLFLYILKLRVFFLFLKSYKKQEMIKEYEIETVADKAQNIYHLAPTEKVCQPLSRL